MKKWLSVMIACMILFNLCACGEAASPTSVSSESSDPTAAEAVSPTADSYEEVAMAAPAETLEVLEEVPPSPETIRNKLIVDESYMTATYETCYTLIEDCLSGKTVLLESNHTYSFTKEDSENIRYLTCDGIETNVMVSLLRNGSQPAPDEQIDYIFITLAGSGSAIQSKMAFFQMCAIGTVLLTHPEINSENEALQFYNEVMSSENADKWISVGELEYSGGLSSLGTDVNIVSFMVRVAEQYSEPSSEDINDISSEVEQDETAGKDYIYFPMDSYEFIDAYNRSEHALGTLEKNSNTMKVTGTNLEIVFFVWDISENATPPGMWAIPEMDYNAMAVRLVTHGHDQYDTDSLTAITLIGQSFAEIFDPTFDCNDFIKNSSTSVTGNSIKLSYSHNGYEYKLEGGSFSVGSSSAYDYDFIISLSANAE